MVPRLAIIIERDPLKDSHEDTKSRRDKEEMASILVDCAFRLHRDLGPGLLETGVLNLPLGLLINFGAAPFKEGCKRIVNGPQSLASSCLRVNQTHSAQKIPLPGHCSSPLRVVEPKSNTISVSVCSLCSQCAARQ